LSCHRLEVLLDPCRPGRWPLGVRPVLGDDQQMTALKTRILLVVATATVAALAAGARAYRRDLTTARNRLAAVLRHHVSTPFGMVEYAESGAGDPVLVSHGIFHGCDGGLLSVRSSLPGRRIIAPSRFGYLGSDLPTGATPMDQADAFAALLDHLELARSTSWESLQAPPLRCSSSCGIRTGPDTSS